MQALEGDPELRLTEDIVRKYLAIPAQLRRVHISVFPGLAAEAAKDDNRFYAYLTNLLNGDLAPIMKFDRAMKKGNHPA